MTNIQKNDIVEQIAHETERLGSASKVSGWQIAETTNYRRLTNILENARQLSMFVAVSHKAGSGKTATINEYCDTNHTQMVFKIQAREWARREFLINLCKTLGIDKGRGYVSVDQLDDKVTNFFDERSALQPQLIIDEADKLKPSALRYLIPFYNRLEDKCSCVICGTDNLEKEIKKGVRSNAKGYDEIDDRFGRNFLHLVGATANDVAKICSVNGITDPEVHRTIFRECKPISIVAENRSVKIVESMRRIKRLVQRELLKQSSNRL